MQLKDCVKNSSLEVIERGDSLSYNIINHVSNTQNKIVALRKKVLLVINGQL